MNINDEELKKIILSNSQAKKIIQENQELLTDVVRSEVTKEDNISVGFRKISNLSGMENYIMI